MRAAVLALFAIACDGSTLYVDVDASIVDTAPDAADLRVVVAEVPATPNRDLDVLFVIDDSPAMLDKQAHLRASIPAFLEALSHAPGGLPNLHVAVVTSDMGTSFSGGATPAPSLGTDCAGAGKGGKFRVGTAALADNYLVDVDGATNYTGTLAANLDAMLDAGATGCGFEQHLAAMRAALDGRDPENVGFLRANANLLIVFVADEDDCSAKSGDLFSPDPMPLGPVSSFRCFQYGVRCPAGGITPEARAMVGMKDYCEADPESAIVDDVTPYRDFLVGLEVGARRVHVGGIVGPSGPVAVELRPDVPAVAHTCTYQGPTTVEVADPAIRFERLFDAFTLAGRAAVSSICRTSYDDNMRLLGALGVHAIGTSCLARAIADLDPMPGLQPDCIVEDLVGTAATAIPACDANLTPACWHVDDDASCPASTRLVVERGGVAIDPATVTRARCRT